MNGYYSSRPSFALYLSTIPATFFLVFRSDFTQKKEDLEASLDDMTKKLKSMKKKLDIEYQWRNTSDGLHHKTLRERSHLITK